MSSKKQSLTLSLINIIDLNKSQYHKKISFETRDVIRL